MTYRKHDPVRRRFLSRGAKALVGSGLALGGHPALTLVRAAEGELGAGEDYRALVCVFLQGGCDGFSLLVPNSGAEYNEYASTRGNLALDAGSLRAINPSSGNHGPVAVHPDAAPMQAMFEEGKLAFVANVGNLLEPTTREQYEAGSVILPNQLFSHSDQARQWQQLNGPGRSSEGWGARAASYLRQSQAIDYLTSVTMSGHNYWQSGIASRPFSLTEAGVRQYSGLDITETWQQPRVAAFRKILNAEYGHLMAAEYAHIQRRAIDITTSLGEALEGTSGLMFEAEEDTLGAKLSMVAQVIAAHEQLGMSRQIFFINMNGFDVHDNQNTDLPVLFAELSQALQQFQFTLDSIGMGEKVTTFTASDFGRSLTSNGDGTDHGWGNHLAVMGGAVNGGEIYGTLPRLDVNGADSVHNGRILPTLAASQYAATLLRWIGLDEAALDYVLPELSNFETRDLGFIG